MSLSRNRKIWGVAENLLNRLAKKSSRALDRNRRTRKLAIDQLEERQLLSLTVATPENLLVNTTWQDIRGDVAVDSNTSGDVVVAWTAADRLANPDYDPADPSSSVYLLDESGKYVEDLNIYARYLTDEVQILTIPEECVPGATLDDGTKVQSGSVEVIYNAYETQRLSIFSSNFTYGDDDVYSTSNSQACFYLGLYAEGELTWILYRYDYNLLPGDNAANLQAAIRAIPGNEYSEVVVTAYSETDFDVTFYGDNWAGYDLTDIRVSSDYYGDMTTLIDKVSDVSFDVSELDACSTFQKLALKDLFGASYKTTIANMIKSSGRRSVVRTLQTARDSLVNNLVSGNVTTVKEVQTVTSYNKKGMNEGIVVSNDPYVTAQNIQNAFNNASQQGTLYAPITRGYVYNEKTHRYEPEKTPTRPYSTSESYGTMQAPISPIEVVVKPVDGTKNQFYVTFTGASGLIDQDSLIISAATYSTKIGKNYVYTDVVTQNPKTNAYEYVGTQSSDYSPQAKTIKQSSNVFRVNAVETADFVVDEDGDVVYDRYGAMQLNGTGRTDQSKPAAAIAEDGSFVIAWQNENADALDLYNATDVYARRFVVQGYIDESDPYYGKLNFYANGATSDTEGKIGYQPPETAYDASFVADPYTLETDSTKVQCVRPVADAFIVNASINGMQTDPAVSADLNGNFIVAWTYIAQDNSYFGGIYGRQFNNEAEPITGDITFASSQVSSNHFGPATVSMSNDGFSVVAWNYVDTLYYSVLEPQNDVFIADSVVVGTNAYSPSVDFDYNGRFALAYTQETESEAEGTEAYPATDVALAVYAVTPTGVEDNSTAFNYVTSSYVTAGDGDDSNSSNTGNDDSNDSQTSFYIGRRMASIDYTISPVSNQLTRVRTGDQGNPSISVDADGDVFLVYQGFGVDIHYPSTTTTTGLFIDLDWSDFEDNNLAYENKQFYRGQKYSYESKNEDLIPFIKLALGWGYDEDGALVNDGSQTPVYEISTFDTINPDLYIKYFLTVAQREKATNEQLMRLNAILETLVSNLRNNGNDVGFANYAQTLYASTPASSSDNNNNNNNDNNSNAAATVDFSTLVYDGVVSSYRNGSDACFYIALPAAYVSGASMSLTIGRKTDCDYWTSNADTAETLSLDLGTYYTNGFLTVNGLLNMIDGVNDAFNSLAICDGQIGFVARYLGLDEFEFYKDTYGEIGLDLDEFQYYYAYTVDSNTYYGWRTVEDYVVLQVTATNVLHDTPLYIAWDYLNSSMTLVDQANEDANYYYRQGVYVENYGSTGNFQTNPHAAESSNGDVVVVWAMQNQANATQREDVYPSIGNDLATSYSHIYMRPFTESTDTAGPIVTNFSTPNGEKVDNGDTVTHALKDLVVAFNEDMITMDGTSYNNTHAVDNPANWYLLKDGVVVTGAIESITFGMNASETLARETVDETSNPVEEINDGALAYGTNRWEAVVHLADGYELTDGDYTLVCSNLVQDTARNGLYAQGYAEDGSSAGYDGRNWECSFNVIPLNEALAFEYSDAFPYNDSYIPVENVHGDDPGATSGDFVVDAETSGETLRQVTRSSILKDDSDYGPNTAQSVASDANGNVVVVWVEESGTLDDEGNGSMTKTVYARTYRRLYVLNAEGVREQVIDSSIGASDPIPIYVSTNVYENGLLVQGEDPRQASVAMDDSGNFVVVWDMVTEGVETKGSNRDVYMAKYSFNGGQLMINGNNTTPTLVNVETDDDQQYASVAMDSDGDIVVVWESYGQDGSGWGIYGRRFFADGYSYGYSNTIQTIQFLDRINPQGDRLQMTVLGKSLIVDLSNSIMRNVEAIKNAMVASGIPETNFEIVQTSSNTIAIEFTGDYTGRYVAPIAVKALRFNAEKGVYESSKDFHVNSEMRQIGVEGVEFSVNQTTENNQRYASIGMQNDGTFVVSWTSWGQDLDANVESNIYARKFISNHLVTTTTTTVKELTGGSNPSDFVITIDEIENHEVRAGDGYESVCAVLVGGTNWEGSPWGELPYGDAESLGSGSLLTSRHHVLTAAHVVCDENGVPIDLEDTPIYCVFESTEGNVVVAAEEITVHPSYMGDGETGVDLAVITFSAALPSFLKGYELYTDTNEIGQTFTRVGYGGYGDNRDLINETAEDRPSGVKHIGQNVWELTGTEYDASWTTSLLVSDFDDGSYANDYLGNFYGLRDLGLGDAECNADHGDSGGPCFINGKIAGVTDLGCCNYLNVGYVTPGAGTADVRVSSYVDWINDAVMGSTGSEFLVNTEAAVTVITTDDNGNTTEDESVVITTADYYQQGNQIWSSVGMSADGEFVITWTGYNQDGNGDAQTGGSNNGLGGVFMRGFYFDSADGYVVGSKVFQVNEYTAGDQIHSQAAMSSGGNITVVYESYQDPSNDENSDLADNFGIYARRYSFVTTTQTYYVTDGTGNDAQTIAVAVLDRDIVENGKEFRVSRRGYFEDEYKELGYASPQDADQLGGSVAVDANGDMTFVWTDLSNPYDNVEAVVCMRSITLPTDSTPPYVTVANAVFNNAANDDKLSAVSLIGNYYYFPSKHGPTGLVYSFSEYMYTAQMNQDVKSGAFYSYDPATGTYVFDGLYGYLEDTALENKNVRSVIDYNDWTLTKDGKVVTSTYIYDIVYGYNASIKIDDYLASIGANPDDYIWETIDASNRTDDYELVIIFREELPDGYYTLTVSDNVADAGGKNRLDGNYDGVAGGSFTVRWRIGAAGTTEELVPDTDTEAFTGIYGGEGDPVVAGNEDGFVIVVEKQVLYELGTGTSSGSGNNNNNNNTNNNNTNNDDVYGYYETIEIDGTQYRIESDIVLRRFDASGSPVGVETVVNRYTEGNQINPDVAMNKSGDFVVAWIGESADALNGVCARFYPGGQPHSEQVQVAGTKGMRCWDVDVAINEETGVVLITWCQGSKNSGTEADEMYGRFYDVNGNELGVAFKIIPQSEGKSVQNFDVASSYVNGQIRYVCTWQMYVEGTRSFEIFQKVITAGQYGNYYSVTSSTAPIRVNDSTAYGQYAPQICTNQDTGEYFIVWVSDHNQGNGGDIYAKRFDSYGNPLPFMGTTNEALVNTYVKHVQGAPSVSCNNDGVVFAWESYDAEEYNYNNSTDIKQNQHDYGICCRVFNYEGFPVYIMGDVLAEDENGVEYIQSYEYGQQMPLDEGEFIMNSITSGDQFHPSVQIFDWVSSDLSLYKVPKFVVTWAGPNEYAASEIEEDDTTGNNSGNNSGNNNNNGTNATDATAYVGPYSVFYKLVSIGGSIKTNDNKSTIFAADSTNRYSVDSNSTNVNGFYRPITSVVEFATAYEANPTTDLTVLTITGTDGDDALVATTNAAGKIVAITVNGANVAISTNVEAIYFDGGNGNDSIVYVASGAESAYVDANAKKFVVSAERAFFATDVENVELQGALDVLAIAANAKGDVVSLAPDATTVLGANGFQLSAGAANRVTATGGARASVVMTGSTGDDSFVATNSGALLVGAGFELEAKSFASIRALGAGGTDAATLTDLRSVVATDSATLGATAKSTIAVVGFNSVDAQGVGAGVANVYGTTGADSVLSDSATTTTNFSTGSVATIAGFTGVNIDGRGGVDVATLFAGPRNNFFEGWDGKATLTNGSYRRALSNFSNVVVFGADEDEIASRLTATLHNTARDDAFAAYGDGATMEVDGVALYSVFGADRVDVKRDYASGSETFDVDDAIDFVFAADDWDF